MIDCCCLKENIPDTERTVLIRENIYVRVHGHVRVFGGKRSVVAFRVAPLADINEVTTHILEVIHAHIYLTRSTNQPMVRLLYCLSTSPIQICIVAF